MSTQEELSHRGMIMESVDSFQPVCHPSFGARWRSLVFFKGCASYLGYGV